MTECRKANRKPIVFMFSGQGSQYYRMGEELYKTHAVFKYWMDALDRIIIDKAGFSVVDKLYRSDNGKSEPFLDLACSHPAIVAVEYALAKALMSEGVQPDYFLGSSLGEFTAAALSEAIDIDTLLKLVLHQSKELNTGETQSGMTAVILTKDRLYPIIKRFDCELAGENTDSHFVIAGLLDNIEKCHQVFREEAVTFQPLVVDQAFHSHFLDVKKDVVFPFICQQNYSPLKIPLFSCATQKRMDLIESDHFWEVIRSPILLATTLTNLEDLGPCIYVDIGPSSTLTNLINLNSNKNPMSECISVMDPFGSDLDRFDRVKEKFHRIGIEISEYQKRDSLTREACLFPGQGSQKVGMGKELFSRFPKIVEQADKILGYSIEDLCLIDKNNELSNTRFTQPALYVVEVLSYLQYREKNGEPHALAGHSLGEYAALFAAGVFDFGTGLKLVQKRGSLMAKADVDGGMAAILNISADKISSLLNKSNLLSIDIANFNKPTQTVIAGPLGQLKIAERLFARVGANFVPLNVSAPFHSRYMEPVVSEFSKFLDTIDFSAPRIPVLSNVTARPHTLSKIKDLLAKQISNSVRWTESIQYLMGQGTFKYIEIGPGDVLTKLVGSIQTECDAVDDTDTPLFQVKTDKSKLNGKVPPASGSGVRKIPVIGGNEGFTKDFSCKSNYLIGPVDGDAESNVAHELSESGFLTYIALPIIDYSKADRIVTEAALRISRGHSLGVQFSSDVIRPELEGRIAELLVQKGIQHIQAWGFSKISPALVKLRIKLLSSKQDQGIRTLLARVETLKEAEAFLNPPPKSIIQRLLKEGDVSEEEAKLAETVPMADAILFEGDWHKLQALVQLRDQKLLKGSSRSSISKVWVGSSNAIGSPSTVANAIRCGAEFVLSDQVFQTTAESSQDEKAKTLLQSVSEDDISTAPCHELFEFGKEISLLNKDSKYAGQARKLFEIWKSANSIEVLTPEFRNIVDSEFFPQGLSVAWNLVKSSKGWFSQSELESAEVNEKLKMTLLCKYYLKSMDDSRLETKDRLIKCKSEQGEFNRWINQSGLVDWQSRNALDVAHKVIIEACEIT